MGTDLHIVNNARVSFDQESEEFTPKERGLLNFLMRERHGSPWEAVVYRFDVKAPIFVVREWQRHRVGCLTGDTLVSFVDTTGAAPKSLRKSMAELHRMWTEGERNAESRVKRGPITGRKDSKWRVRRMRVRVLNEDTNEFTVGHIADVVDSGIKQVFRVVTEAGRTIEMTAEHEVYTDRGWKRLGELARIDGTHVDLPTDAYMMANGTVAHQDPAWLEEQRIGVASAIGNLELPPLRERRRPRGRRLVAHADRVVSVTYVGVARTYDLCIEGPWHNFVANGLVVHNSFNEQSARYSQVPDHYYVPEEDYVREQRGKPGSYFFGQIEDAAVRASTIEMIEKTQRDAFAAYHAMLDQGVAKELARTVLPVGMFSRMKWTVNLRSLFNFLQLRNHEHAQREIRDYAAAVEQLARSVVPVAFEVFEENGRVCP